MKHNIRIESGVPIPAHKNRGRKPDPLPFDKLEVGQDMLIERISKEDFGSIRQKAQYQRRKTGKRFSCLYFHDSNSGRVWRVS